MSAKLTATDFTALLTYITEEIGITLPETNYSLVDSFVSAKLAGGNYDLSRYLKELRNNEEELAEFIDAVTINETYFFRESRQFDILYSFVFPKLREHGITCPKIWSSSCSTGEEAISLYLVANKYFGPESGTTVYATDVNRHAIDIFEAGIYRKNSFRQDGEAYHPLVKQFAESSGPGWRVGGNIISRITKLPANLDHLVDSSLPRDFDLIFLRNTLIYFDFSKRGRIISSLADRLKEGGYLFLSSTEMPLISHPDLALIEVSGQYFFRKKNMQEKGAGTTVTEAVIQELKSHDLEKQREPAGTRPAEKKTNGRPEGWSIDGRQIDLSKVMAFANQKLNNRIFSIPGDVEYELSLLLLSTVYAMNTTETEDAFRMLEEFRHQAGEHDVTLYLRGYLSLIGGLLEEASEQFTKALAMNPLFWPARYQQAMLFKAASKYKAAVREFKICLTHIERYVESGNFDFQFLLEGFNGKYFAQICKNMIRNLHEQG